MNRKYVRKKYVITYRDSDGIVLRTQQTNWFISTIIKVIITTLMHDVINIQYRRMK